MTQLKIPSIPHKRLRELGFDMLFQNIGSNSRATFSFYTRRPTEHGGAIVSAVLLTYNDDAGGGWKLFIEAGANTIDIDDTLDDFERLLDEALES